MKIRKAILIIHGFAGSPYDEEILAQYLELNYNFDVYTYTLPGHENVLFMKNNYEDWINASINQVEFLIKNGYRSIYLIGHSMGGVIASFLATKYKQIKKLVLAAPAFKYVYNKEESLKDNIKKGSILIKDYGYEQVLKRVFKTSIKSTKEFMKLVETFYAAPSKVTIPTLIIQGLDDNVVPKESSEYVYNSLSSRKILIYVEGVNHDIFRSAKVNVINREINEFLKKKYIVNDTKIIGV